MIFTLVRKLGKGQLDSGRGSGPNEVMEQNAEKRKVVVLPDFFFV